MGHPTVGEGRAIGSPDDEQPAVLPRRVMRSVPARIVFADNKKGDTVAGVALFETLSDVSVLCRYRFDPKR